MNLQVASAKSSDAKAAVFGRIDALLPELEKIYIDLHKHPELSMQEVRTAGIAVALAGGSWLRGPCRHRQDRRGRPA
jgi:hypothetical protein